MARGAVPVFPGSRRERHTRAERSARWSGPYQVQSAPALYKDSLSGGHPGYPEGLVAIHVLFIETSVPTSEKEFDYLALS